MTAAYTSPRAHIGPILSGVAVTALWFLCRPYAGILYDSRIYMERALGDLDPSGLGRQFDLIHDGQTGFSIFPPLLRHAVSAFGPGPAAMAISGLGLLLWWMAAMFLVSRLFTGRAFWGALICLAAFPVTYGGFAILHAAEALATPRVFAEAAGLAALALLLDKRRLAAVALWVLAMVLHPIMGLAVAGVGVCWLGFADRRWFFLAGGVVLAVLAAAVLQAPVAARLLEPIDTAWRQVLLERCPFLFPQLWPDHNQQPRHQSCHPAGHRARQDPQRLQDQPSRLVFQPLSHHSFP